MNNDNITDALHALELAKSHIDWCWDIIEEHTRLRREGSQHIHTLIDDSIRRLLALEDASQQKGTDALADRLETWAQNEEMVDQRFTEHGRDCNAAANRLRALEATP